MAKNNFGFHPEDGLTRLTEIAFDEIVNRGLDSGVVVAAARRIYGDFARCLALAAYFQRSTLSSAAELIGDVRLLGLPEYITQKTKDDPYSTSIPLSEKRFLTSLDLTSSIKKPEKKDPYFNDPEALLRSFAKKRGEERFDDPIKPRPFVKDPEERYSVAGRLRSPYSLKDEPSKPPRSLFDLTGKYDPLFQKPQGLSLEQEAVLKTLQPAAALRLLVSSRSYF